MKVKWNNCFLCLNELSRADLEEGRRRRGRNDSNSKLFFSYLLDSRNKISSSGNDLVLQTVWKYFEEPSGREPCGEPDGGESEREEGVKLHFCGNCRTSVELISRWHKQLEILQMRILEQVKMVREEVLANSKLYGGSDGRKMCLQIFEEWLEWKEQRGEGDGEGRRILDALYAFQTAVFECGKGNIDVPLVYLERYNNCVPPPPQPPPVPINMLSSEIKMEQGHVHEHDDDDLNLGESRALPSFQDSMICSDPHVDDNDPFFDDHHIFAKDFEAGLSPSNEIVKENSDNQIQILHSPQKEMPPEKKLSRRKMKSKGPAKASKNSTRNIKTDRVKGAVGSEKCSIMTETIIAENSEKPPRRSARRQAAKRIISNIKIESQDREKNPKDDSDDDDEFIIPTKVTKDDTTPKNPPKSLKKRGRKPKGSESKPASSTQPPKPKRSRHGPRGPYKKKERKSNKPRVTDSYECALCSLKVVTIFKFEQHLRTHENPDDIHFICLKCDDQRFSNKQHYELHLSFHEQGAIKIQCEECSKKVPLLEAKSHMESHSSKVFPCQHCSFCCISRERFLEHIRLHSTSTFTCDLCPQNLAGRNKLVKHLDSAHQAIEKFRCEAKDCGKEFIDKQTFWSHKQSHKLTGNEFTCLTCNKSFCDALSLAVHERLHTGEKPFGCEECVERFRLKVGLDRHRIRVHGAAKLQCQYCPKEFADQSHLVSHTRLHEGTGFPCRHCDKIFGSAGQWRRHQIVHTREKNFVCDECGKAFGTRALLNKHLKIHIGDKQFKCTYCPSSFIFDRYLQAHLRIHTGEKPFVCDDCGKAFNQYAALHVHKKRHKAGGLLPKELPPPPPPPVEKVAVAVAAPSSHPPVPLEIVFKIDEKI